MGAVAHGLVEDVTGQLSELVRARLGRDQGDVTERFVRQFYADVPPDDVAQAPTDQLFGAALAIWQWGRQRTPGAAQVRVYNPRLEEHGWRSTRTIVEIVNDDMPFLVDSVTAELNRRGLTVHLVIHPVVRVARDAQGRLADLYEPTASPIDALAESFMHVEIDPRTAPEELEAIRSGIARVLADVRAAVGDWAAMRSRLGSAAEGIAAAALPADEVAEGGDFLGWVAADHFTFLGCREYRLEETADGPALRLVEGSALGILRDPSVVVLDALRADGRALVQAPRAVLVAKADRASTVHRPVPMDVILVKRFDTQGRIAGERLFVGLFTSAAYNRSPRDIPFVRRKVAGVLERAGFDPAGHNGKALLNILETYPRDELFQAGVDELTDTALGILHLQERQRLALFVRRDPFGRFASCLVYVPRDRYDSDLRRRLQRILEEAFGGETASFSTQFGESALARIHVIVKAGPAGLPEADLALVESRLVHAARTWSDRLRDALVEARGEEVGGKLRQAYETAFAASYREAFTAEAAVHDIERIEAAVRTGRLGINLYRPLEAEPAELHFKIYHEGRPVPLSDVLPMLEHMDLKVITEQPFEVTPASHPTPVW
ncbi:NAD-glutamate dehydrogenase, partial [Azospirillum sp. TSO22-1]